MRRFVLFILSGLLLAACSSIRGDATPIIAVGSTPGRALATIWLSPTPVPSPIPTSDPTLTPAPTVPLPTPALVAPTQPIFTPSVVEGSPQAVATQPPVVSCLSPPPEPFGQVWGSSTSLRQRIGCSSGETQQRKVAFQAFEHGYMIWVEAEDSIYVLSTTAIQQGQATDTWWRLADTWSDGEPVRDDSLVPPGGLLQPERGFGKVWRNNGFVREAVGWATSGEQGHSAGWQTFESGWMMTTPSAIFAMVFSGDGSSTSGLHFGPR